MDKTANEQRDKWANSQTSTYIDKNTDGEKAFEH